MTVTRFEGQGRKDEEVRGDEPQKGCLITQNKTVTAKRKQKLRRSSSLVVWSSAVGLSLSRCSLLPPHCRPAGAFSSLPGNHWNQIQVLIIIHLPTDSPLVSEPALPLARSAFPRPPSPHTPTARLRPVSPPACSPPPHSWRGSRLPPSAPPACGPPWT